MRSARDFNDNYRQVKAICQNVTKLMRMREQALAPLAMFERTTAGTLNSNASRLTLACIGIDLALGFARVGMGTEEVPASDDDEDEGLADK